MEGDLSGGSWSNLSGGISIHALRVEGDIFCCAASNSSGISIHALRVEGDPVGRVSAARRAFLSTPSGWRATNYGKLADMILEISIHALRVEGD